MYKKGMGHSIGGERIEFRSHPQAVIHTLFHLWKVYFFTKLAKKYLD
jgi:hypothetical protein